MEKKIRKFGALLMAVALAFAGANAAQAETVAKIGEKSYETLAEAIAAAETGDKVEIVKADTYSFPSLPNNITLSCCDGVIFNCEGSGSISSVPNGCIVIGGTFNMGQNNYHGWQHAGAMAFNGSLFNGKFFGYANLTFTGCHFVQTAEDYCMWTYSSPRIDYINCTFDCKGKAVNVYWEQHEGPTEVTADGCTFNSSKENKPALKINSKYGAFVVATTANNTLSGFPRGISGYDNEPNEGDYAYIVTNAEFDEAGKLIGGDANCAFPEAIANQYFAADLATVSNTEGEIWKIGVKTEDNTIITTKPQESKVEIPQDVEIATEVQQKIEQSTKVEGVKLSVTETGAKPAGIVAVVDTAKTQDQAFAAAVETAAEVSVKVEVEVKPTEYDNTADKGKVAFKLTPKATVTVVQEETKLEQVVEVTNDMIDQNQKIAVSIYTGFAPATILHKDDNGVLIESFSGDGIVYDEKTGVATVKISHFSSLLASQEEIKHFFVDETNETLWHVANVAGLAEFRDAVNGGNAFAGKTVVLDADINLESVASWTPIGTSTTPFAGTFDGNEKTISGLKITGESSYVGLFGYLGAAMVQDLALVGANVTGVKRVGALVGQIKGSATVKNCTLDSTSRVEGSDSNTGGLIGEVSGEVTVLLENLENNATVVNTENGTSRAAGIVGQATSKATVTVKNCVNKGQITTNSGYTGGIMSAKQGKASVTFDGCSNTGTLTDGTKGTGDLLAWMCNGGSVTIANYSGDVSTAIGWMSQDDYDNYVTIGEDECYVRVANGGDGYTFATLYANKANVDKKYLENICAFFIYAKSENPNFEGYPETPMALMGKAYNSTDNEPVGTFFNSNTTSGWPQLLEKYNTACGKSMTADDFVVTWGTKDKLYCVKEVVPVEEIEIPVDESGEAVIPVKIPETVFTEAEIKDKEGKVIEPPTTTAEKQQFLVTEQPNGLKVWQNVAMGVDGNTAGNALATTSREPTAEEKAAATTAGKTIDIIINTPISNFTPPETTGVTVSYKLLKSVNGGVVWTVVAENLEKPEFPAWTQDNALISEGDTFWKFQAVFTSQANAQAE